MLLISHFQPSSGWMFLRLSNCSSSGSYFLQYTQYFYVTSSYHFTQLLWLWLVAFSVFLLVLTYLLKFRFSFHFPSPIRPEWSHFSLKALHSDWNLVRALDCVQVRSPHYEKSKNESKEKQKFSQWVQSTAHAFM